MKIKQLILYLGSILLVIVLFTLATSYGEANLKTADKIEGIYRIESSIPTCGQNLQIVIQQSGTYINAAIATLGEKPKGFASELSGRWQAQKLSLSGNTCKSEIAIEAEVKDRKITGKIVAFSSQIFDFSANQIEVTEVKEEKFKSH